MLNKLLGSISKVQIRPALVRIKYRSFCLEYNSILEKLNQYTLSPPKEAELSEPDIPISDYKQIRNWNKELKRLFSLGDMPSVIVCII